MCVNRSLVLFFNIYNRICFCMKEIQKKYTFRGITCPKSIVNPFLFTNQILYELVFTCNFFYPEISHLLMKRKARYLIQSVARTRNTSFGSRLFNNTVTYFIDRIKTKDTRMSLVVSSASCDKSSLRIRSNVTCHATSLASY